MTEQMGWILAIAAVIVAAVISFFVGRRSGSSKERIEELETEVTRQKEEISTYKQEVESHFDKTATLFVSMAGSYKDLFEHLSSGYEKLSEGSARELFKERVAALLLDGPKSAEGSGAGKNPGPDESPTDDKSSAHANRDESVESGAADSAAGTTPDEEGAAPATASGSDDPAEPKAAEPKAAEPKAAEPKAAEPKAAADDPSVKPRADATEIVTETAKAKSETGSEAGSAAGKASTSEPDSAPESTVEKAARKRTDVARAQASPTDGSELGSQEASSEAGGTDRQAGQGDDKGGDAKTRPGK
ncbi:ZapG family protein [Rhodocyclaceae bacterium SMB388]